MRQWDFKMGNPYSLGSLQMNTALLGICCVLIVVFAITVTAAIIYQTRLNMCNTAKNPWCYKDWKCLKPVSIDVVGVPEVIDSVQTLINKCTPMFDDPTATIPDAGTQRVNRLNAAGCRNIFPNPSVETGGHPRCVPRIGDTDANGPRRCLGALSPTGEELCPAYALGDVDWTTETGCVPARGYQGTA